MSLRALLLSPLPFRTHFFRYLRKLKNRMLKAPYLYRAVFGEVDRPSYGYCIYHAALLAKALGIPKISIIEFGVFKGEGLLNIEYHIANIREELDIEFEVYGFDAESGLPPTSDYRDIKFRFASGDYKMDRAALEAELKISKLVIGDVKDTCKNFFDTYKPAPIGCVFFDLDYYTATRDAFSLFDTASSNYLPRVPCYFDDILGTTEYIGELRAIAEFNEKHETKKIAKPYGLYALRRELWCEKIFSFHDLAHPRYNDDAEINRGSGVIRVDSLNW